MRSKMEKREDLIAMFIGLRNAVSCISCHLSEGGKKHLIDRVNRVIGEEKATLKDLGGCLDSLGHWERHVDEWLK